MDNNKSTIQYSKLVMAFISLIGGLILLFIGLFLPPKGFIDPTVLVAFGEILVFAGAVINVHLSYSTKLAEIQANLEKYKTLGKDCPEKVG